MKPTARDILGQVFFWSRQSEILSSVISELLLSSYTTNKCFSLSRFIEVVQSFFSSRLLDCVKSGGLEQLVLRSVMPRVWTALLRLLVVLVKVVGDDLLPLLVRTFKVQEWFFSLSQFKQHLSFLPVSNPPSPPPHLWSHRIRLPILGKREHAQVSKNGLSWSHQIYFCSIWSGFRTAPVSWQNCPVFVARHSSFSNRA